MARSCLIWCGLVWSVGISHCQSQCAAHQKLSERDGLCKTPTQLEKHLTPLHAVFLSFSYTQCLWCLSSSPSSCFRHALVHCFSTPRRVFSEALGCFSLLLSSIVSALPRESPVLVHWNHPFLEITTMHYKVWVIKRRCFYMFSNVLLLLYLLYFVLKCSECHYVCGHRYAKLHFSVAWQELSCFKWSFSPKKLIFPTSSRTKCNIAVFLSQCSRVNWAIIIYFTCIHLFSSRAAYRALQYILLLSPACYTW